MLKRFVQRFVQQWRARWQELNGPACNHDVFALHRTTSGLQVIEDGLRTDDELARLLSESDEYIHIQSGCRLEIEGGAHGTTDGVPVNDAISLHFIYGRNGFFDVHGALGSVKSPG